MLIVDLGADHVDVAVERLSKWRFLRRDWQISSDEDIEALEEWLINLETKTARSSSCLWLAKSLWIRKPRLDELLEHHADLLAAIETWERYSDLVVIPDDADLDHFGLSGFAATR